MQLEHMRAVSRWHTGHRGLKPVEFIVWQGMVGLWLAGWIGVAAGLALDALRLACIGAVIVAAPEAYGHLRRALDQRSLVRCDWADSLPAASGRRRERRGPRASWRLAGRWCLQHAHVLVCSALVVLLVIGLAAFTHLLDGAVTTPLLELELGL